MKDFGYDEPMNIQTLLDELAPKAGDGDMLSKAICYLLVKEYRRQTGEWPNPPWGSSK